MQTYRIVYIDDDTFAPRTLTAAFASRAAAELAMARHGHRVVHIAEMRAGESAADPIRIEIACGSDRLRPEPTARRPKAVWPTQLALARHGIVGVVAVLGFAAAGAAYLLF